MKKIFIFLLISVALIFVGIVKISYAAAVYNGHYYEMVSSSPSSFWSDAEAAAVSIGGHLVTINDAAEEAWLKTTFAVQPYYIGFNDITTEGVWEWVSGEPVTYTNWNPGEPNNTVVPGVYDGEDVAVMNFKSSDGWNDVPTNYASASFGIAEYAVPIPPAAWLFGSSLIGILGIRRKFRRK